MLDFLKNYRLRRLDPSQGYKPLDFGGRGINGSLTWDGRIVAINVYHPLHGYVTLTSVPPFPDEDRYNPPAVRAYRKNITANEGFGLHFFSPIVQREAWLIEDVLPYLRLTLENGIVAETIIYVTQPPSPLGVVQCWGFSEYGELAHFSGKVWLQRCAYTQLTEGGVIEMPSSRTKIFYQHKLGYIGLENPELQMQAFISGYGCEERADGSVEFLESRTHYPEYGEGWQVTQSHDTELWINIDRQAHPLLIQDPQPFIEAIADSWQPNWEAIPDDPILRRGLVYGLNCCVPVNEEAVCLLTDHMLLPLSWNRDAYYVAAALMHWNDQGKDMNRRHLIWMFEVAERINGFWGRAYLANGKVKDKAFQLDQQLFPLLELAEYVQITGDPFNILARLQPHIDPLIDGLIASKSPEGWLFPTEETAADDRIPYPYPLASHILMWRTFSKLAELDFESRHDFRQLAAHIRASLNRHFIAEHNGKRIYAYAIDGAGGYHFYHDANDFPLVLAPAWGLVGANDPIWRATIDFAFSEANAGGFYDGSLGSVHTPAPWALGEIQEIIVARALGDNEREARVRARLRKAAQWDGALPEAYAANTGEVVSRHWFAWTNAAYACLELGVFDK
jgi:hypothetical protein